MFSKVQSTYRNPVCKVRFLGWESTTRDLELAGWQLSAEQDPVHRTIRLALYHPVAKTHALTNSLSFGSTMHTWGDRGMAEYAYLLAFDVVAMHHDLRCSYITMPQASKFGWSPVSAFPEACTSSYEERGIADMIPFRAVNANAEQIVIAPESVTKVLDLLLACQAPAAQARRLKERQAVRRASDIQAQVVVEVA